jgi:hypothetical protein
MRVNFGLYTEKERKPMDMCSMLMEWTYLYMYFLPFWYARQCTGLWALSASAGGQERTMWCVGRVSLLHIYVETHTHTHTHIYIYIYIYMCVYMFILFSHVLACDLPSLSCRGKAWEKKKTGNVLSVSPFSHISGFESLVISIVLASLFRGAAPQCF